MLNFMFFLENTLLGVGLSMDAFSVSLANGLNDKCMKKGKMFSIAGLFAFFQALMPMIGWILVHTLLQYFTAFEKFIPWIALALLLFIGIKMIVDTLKKDEDDCGQKVGFLALLIQGLATSIDALSVGFTIAEYEFWMALIAVLIIGVITFGLCFAGVVIGKKFGTKLKNKAGLLGGIILILIGIEIFLTGIL